MGGGAVGVPGSGGVAAGGIAVSGGGGAAGPPGGTPASPCGGGATPGGSSPAGGGVTVPWGGKTTLLPGAVPARGFAPVPRAAVPGGAGPGTISGGYTTWPGAVLVTKLVVTTPLLVATSGARFELAPAPKFVRTSVPVAPTLFDNPSEYGLVLPNTNTPPRRPARWAGLSCWTALLSLAGLSAFPWTADVP